MMAAMVSAHDVYGKSSAERCRKITAEEEGRGRERVEF